MTVYVVSSHGTVYRPVDWRIECNERSQEARRKQAARAETERARAIKRDTWHGPAPRDHANVNLRDRSRYDHRAHVAPTIDAAMPFTGIDAPEIVRLVDDAEWNRGKDAYDRRQMREALAVTPSNGATVTHRTLAHDAASDALADRREATSVLVDTMAQTSFADVHAEQMDRYRSTRPVRTVRVSKWVRVR